MPPTYYRSCWHVVSRGFLLRYRHLLFRGLSSLPIELYIPKYFFTHAASLHQGFPHCAIFPTAASRRSLGRVSVPMWPSTLSGRLLIVALVGRYLTNWLISRGAISYRLASFHSEPCGPARLCGIISRFQLLSPGKRQVLHVLLTRPPLRYLSVCRSFLPHISVRLACVRHAASVYPEPGSNSRVNFYPVLSRTGYLLLTYFLINKLVHLWSHDSTLLLS